MSTPSSGSPFGHVVEAADQVDQGALARTAVAHQADHLARLDVQGDAAVDGAVAVAEADFAQVDAAFDLLQLHRLAGSGTLETWSRMSKMRLGGSRLLRHGDDAAHRIEAAVEARDVGDEGGQHADGDFAARHLPDAEAPDDQQADLGQERDGGREQRPDLVQLVVDGQVVRVGVAEAGRFALFLRKGLDHADAGNGVGQHVGDFAHTRSIFSKPVRRRSRTSGSSRR
jgi:hypothetical protein